MVDSMIVRRYQIRSCQSFVYQRYTLVTKPFGEVFGPGGSSTKPSVPARLRKSPEPLGGRGVAQGRPQSLCSMATGRKYVSGGWNVTGAASARRSGGVRR